MTAAFNRLRCPELDDVGQHVAQHVRHRGMHDSLAALRLGTEDTVIRSAVGEAQLVDQHGWATPPVIDDDAHQLRQGAGPVRTSCRGRSSATERAARTGIPSGASKASYARKRRARYAS